MVRPAEAAATTGFDFFRAAAHRFFCAKLIRLRAEADRLRRPFECELPKAASAAVKRWTSCCALPSSFFNSPTTPDIGPIFGVPPRLTMIANLAARRFRKHSTISERPWYCLLRA
jgi:hypothetical protein